MKYLKIMGLMVLVTVLALPAMHACKQAAEAPPAAPVKELKVAVVTDLTGPNAAYIANTIEGTKAYFEWQNEKEGGIDGVQLNVTIYDMAGSMPKAYESVQRAIDDGVVAVFSSSASVTEPTLKLAEANKIPHIAGSPGIKGPWSDWLYATNVNAMGDVYPSILDAVLILWEKQGKPGMGLGKGKGAGPRPEQKDDVDFFDSKVRQKIGPGKAEVVGPAGGPNRPGISRAYMAEKLKSGPAGEANPQSTQRLPRSKKAHVEEYMSGVRERLE